MSFIRRLNASRPGVPWYRLLAVLALLTAGFARGQGTAFTYQGQLTTTNGPLSGYYDFQFGLYDAAVGGNQIGISQVVTLLPVNGGLFTVTLDFGANAFSGPPRYLDLAAHTNGSSAAFVSMTPRQQVTSAPYAVQARTAATASSVVNGVTTTANQTLTGVNNFLNPLNNFFGNGAGLTDIPLSALNTAGTVLGTVTNLVGFDVNQGLAGSSAAGGGLFPLGLVVATNLTGQGNLDLVMAVGGAPRMGGGQPPSLVLFANDGTGSFSVQGVLSQFAPPGASLQALASADLNGDGFADLITVNQTNSATVLTNNGTGGFSVEATLQTGNGPSAVAVADFNGDGFNDFVCANSADNTLSLCLNHAGVGFRAPLNFPTGQGPLSVVAAKFKQNGGADFASANSDWTVTVFLNLSGGTEFHTDEYYLDSAPFTLLAADVNGDGYVDLIAGTVDGVSVLTNRGDGTFAAASTIPVGWPQYSLPMAVVAADLTGTGRPDLVCVAGYAPAIFQVLLNQGNGNFSPSGGWLNPAGVQYSWLGGAAANGSGAVLAGGVAAADFNGDGRADLAMGLSDYRGHTDGLVVLDNTGGTAATGLALAGQDGGLRISASTTGAPNLVAGAGENAVGPQVGGAVIAGGGSPGEPNQVAANDGVVGGGAGNQVQANAVFGVVAGGEGNQVLSSADHAVVGGGQFNTASGEFAVVSGGSQNTAAGQGATVPGGEGNSAKGNLSFAAGLNSTAAHAGAFVWSDSQGGFSSSAKDQFSVSAHGGAQFATYGAGLAVDGNPVLTTTLGKPQTGTWANPLVRLENTSTGANASPALRVVSDGASTPNGALSVSSQGSGLIAQFGNSVAFVSQLDVDGNWTANSFSGDGSGLTGLNASQLGDGTLPSDAFEGYYFRPVGLLNPANEFVGQILYISGNSSGGWTNPVATITNTSLADGHNLAYGGGKFSSPALRIAAAGNTTDGALSVSANDGLIARFGNASGFVADIDINGVAHAASFSSTTGSDCFLGGSMTQNYVDGTASAIVGGLQNACNDRPVCGSVCGGSNNVVGGFASSISGGMANYCSGVAGPATACSISGGATNHVAGFASSALGGVMNYCDAVIEATACTISGGSNNYVSGFSCSILGGYANRCDTSINWGLDDGAEGCAICGGGGNKVSGTGCCIAGGQENQCGGAFCFVAGGMNNSATGTACFAGGTDAVAGYDGSFTWADGLDVPFGLPFENSFAVRARGGVEFVTGVDNDNNPAAGVWLGPGLTSWGTISDRNAKKDIVPVDGAAVLQKLAQVPVSQWRYNWESETNTPNLGPMAQDFIAAFYPGRDDKRITTLEFDGVELAAIQGLNQKLQQKETEIASLKERNDSLARRMSELEAAVKELLQKK